MKNKEIDIVEMIILFYLFIKKHIILLAIFLSIGIGIGIVKTIVETDCYKSKMLVTTFIEKDLIIKIVNSLNEINQKGNRNSALSNNNLPNDFFNKLVSINASSDNKDDNQISIEIEIIDNNYFDSTTIGIMNYLNGNTYLNNQFELRKSQNNILLQKVDEEINELDELQKSNSSNIKGNVIIYDNNYYSEEIITLMEKKQLLETQLNQTSVIEIINKFNDTASSEKSIVKNTLKYSIVFLILGFVVVFFVWINKKAKSYSK